uniref:Death effector domain-containing protein n=1 Tax=Sinocyclocheilus rhinocerous TaxID=307959 RepID=A0A673L0A0_9TELE
RIKIKCPWPEEAVDDAYGLYSLHRMFDIVGAQLTHRDVRVLSFLFVDVIDEYERGGIRSGRDFLLALERQGRCDETNFRHVLQLLRIITRHDLLPYVTLRKRQTVSSLCSIFWQGAHVMCCYLFSSVPLCFSQRSRRGPAGNSSQKSRCVLH